MSVQITSAQKLASQKRDEAIRNMRKAKASLAELIFQLSVEQVSFLIRLEYPSASVLVVHDDGISDARRKPHAILGPDGSTLWSADGETFFQLNDALIPFLETLASGNRALYAEQFSVDLQP